MKYLEIINNAEFLSYAAVERISSVKHFTLFMNIIDLSRVQI